MRACVRLADWACRVVLCRADRTQLMELRDEFELTEQHIKALQSVGQMIGEVLRRLDADRYIVKASSGPRYVVGVRAKVPAEALVTGARVTLDMTTLTVMRILPYVPRRLVRSIEPAQATHACGRA